MILAIALFLSAPAQSEELWTYDAATEMSNVVSINFVRGDIETVRRPGSLRIEVRKTSDTGREKEVDIVARNIDGKLILTDRYPSRAFFSNTLECLPPDSARGDFWSSDVYLMVKIFAPEGVKIETRFLARPNDTARANEN